MQTRTDSRGIQRYGAVVLAAGFSRRLPGENKLLKPWRGQPLLMHALGTVATLGLGDAVVVTGPDTAGIGAIAGRAGLRTVHNPDAGEGMGASIAAGVRALLPGSAGIFIVLGDMPAVSVNDYHTLAAAHQALPARICVPAWEGRRGHPVLFGADYRDALAGLSGDTGARNILAHHDAQVLAVPAASPGVLADLDTAEDFAVERAHTPTQAPQRRKRP